MNNFTDTMPNEINILSIMLKDKEARIEALNNLKAENFSGDLNARLFKTLESMERGQGELDLTLVLQKMNTLGLKRDGDIYKITKIFEEFSSVTTLKQHIEKLIEGYTSNEFKKKMHKFSLSNDLLDTDGVINELNKILENKKVEDTNTISLQEWLLKDTTSRTESDKPKPLGLLTYYRDLDKILKGIAPGSIVTILARSGVGKTTFSLELAKKIACNNNSLTYFSLEMPPEQLYLKMVLSEAKISIDEYISMTRKSMDTFEKIALGSNKISALNINFSQERDIRKIVNSINYYVRKQGVNIFFIDYLNLVSSDIRTSNTDILYNEITAELKQVALKTGATIFLITQANRSLDSQQDKRPNLKDIKSASSIEQNSDYIISLYRNLEFNNPVKKRQLHIEGKLNYNTPNADLNPECFEVIVLKNRHTGQAGTVYLKYLSNLGYIDWMN